MRDQGNLFLVWNMEFTPVVPCSNETPGKPLILVWNMEFTPVVPCSSERPGKPLSSVEHGRLLLLWWWATKALLQGAVFTKCLWNQGLCTTSILAYEHGIVTAVCLKKPAFLSLFPNVSFAPFASIVSTVSNLCCSIT